MKFAGHGLATVSFLMLGTAAPLLAQTSQKTSLLLVEPAPAVPSSASAAFAPFAPIAGQVIQQPAGAPPTPRHTGIRAMAKGLVSDVAHLPSKDNLTWAGIGSGLALAAHPADDAVNRRLVGNNTAENFFKPGEILGELGTLLGTATAIYAVGRIKDEPKVSHLGMDLIRSLAISEGLTQTLKYTTRRERPDHSSRNSFPSGHAADMFAFATALERHLGWRGAVPAYAFSTYVALSRLPANRHWFSNAVFGTAVGVIAGRTVTRHGREYPVAVAVVPGGAALMYVRSTSRQP